MARVTHDDGLASALQRQRWPEVLAAARERAQGAQQPAPELFETLGLACERTGAIEEARVHLERALALKPELFGARLVLGFVEQRQGQPLAAYAHMYWAIRQAQERGVWRDARTTQPWLLGHVQAAVAFVREHPRERLEAVLREAGDGPELQRVRRFVRAQIGLEKLQPRDPRQAPKQHFFPGLDATPWFDPAQFPWTQRLRDAFPDILAEYLGVAGGKGGFEPFLNFSSAEQTAKYLGTTGPVPEWNAFFFYRHGERNDANCARCPKTAALLDELPLIRMPGSTPEVCFSVLTPGSHILPHRGDSNLRSVVHLGLVVPPSCALNVAGEARGWAPGAVLAFDDTYEHEAWNRSDAVRAVLILDAWNPGLTESERRILPSIVGEMNRLGRESERLKPPPA